MTIEKDVLICEMQNEIDNLRKLIRFEEVPDEELFEDGELTRMQVKDKLASRVLQIGDWTIVRRIDGTK